MNNEEPLKRKWGSELRIDTKMHNNKWSKGQKGCSKEEINRVSLARQHSLRASEDPVGATQQSYAKSYDITEDQN